MQPNQIQARNQQQSDHRTMIRLGDSQGTLITIPEAANEQPSPKPQMVNRATQSSSAGQQGSRPPSEELSQPVSVATIVNVSLFF